MENILLKILNEKEIHDQKGFHFVFPPFFETSWHLINRQYLAQKTRRRIEFSQ
jgi:hypothetical protein